MSLSDKKKEIDDWGHGYEGYEEDDVKEFIKKLKIRLKAQEKENCGSLYLNDIEGEINELAGDKLI